MNWIHVTDINSPELDVFRKLSEPQLLHYYEPAPGLFIAESPMIISRALAAGYDPVSFLAEERPDGSVKAVLEQSGCFVSGLPVYTAPLEVLNRITGYALTRGILCAMRRKPNPDPVSLLKNSRRAVILENVMNPANTGAIFRCAAALGMDAVFLTKGCTDPLYRRAARVSMGTVFQIPWSYLNDWPAQIDMFRSCGFRLAAMTLNETCIDLNNLHLGKEEKAALIMGTEGPGVMPGTVAACDLAVRIPMSNGVDSLNVAAAAAVAFWHINRL